jgi:hypothetical protein
MKLIISFFYLLFFFNSSLAQYLGSNGRGDIQLLKNNFALNGQDLNIMNNGSIGRGDVQVLKNAQGLNGEDVNVLYNGGNGRGDIEFLKNAQGLNGENVNILYTGGNGRGDFQLIKNAQGINGEDISIVYSGGNGRGDIFSGITSGFADCAITFYWNGIISEAWENPANWNCNQLPDITSNVVISSGLLHYPVISNSTEIKRLECKTGTSVIINPGVILKVNGQ